MSISKVHSSEDGWVRGDGKRGSREIGGGGGRRDGGRDLIIEGINGAERD